MQSYYNLIKSESALSFSKKKIETNYISKADEIALDAEKSSPEYEIKREYELLGANIIKKAKEDADEIIRKANEKSLEIEKNAYEKGYLQGKENGYEDGYEEALIKVKSDTEEEVKNNIKSSEEILNKANTEYKEYLKEKEEEILKIAFKMASVIVKKELSEDNSLLPLLEDILKEAKGEENIIIKCNSKHVSSIEGKIDYYKKAYAIKGTIFVLEDPLMEEGNALIEKNTGKALIGIDIGLKSIEEALIK